MLALACDSRAFAKVSLVVFVNLRQSVGNNEFRNALIHTLKGYLPFFAALV